MHRFASRRRARSRSSCRAPAGGRRRWRSGSTCSARLATGAWDLTLASLQYSFPCACRIAHQVTSSYSSIVESQRALLFLQPHVHHIVNISSFFNLSGFMLKAMYVNVAACAAAASHLTADVRLIRTRLDAKM